MSIDRLNEDYGITDKLKFVRGKGDFPIVEINNDLAKASISLYGGQILSFTPIDSSEDLMFLSQNAYYKTGKAIKGGCPICWPWFGADPEGKGRSSHGFARNNLWFVSSTEEMASGETKVVLKLGDTSETKAIWSESFNLEISFTIGKTLTIDLISKNTSDRAFSITQALHTYFNIGDIDRVKVLGLEDTKYLDKSKAGKGAEKQQTGAITVSEEVDRIYLDVPSKLIIEDPSLSRQIVITNNGSKTAVVWNPWIEIAKNMGDLQDDDYKNFICVETVNTANEVIEVPPNSEYKLSSNYQIVSI